MTLADTLAARWKWSAEGRLAPAKATLNRALGLPATVQAERAKAATDPNLTAAGQAEATRKFLAGDTAANLLHAKRSAEAMRKQINAWWASLQPPAPDKSDMAAAVLRSEMRAMLREMPNGSRIKMLLSDDVDPRILQAVLEAPDAMSAITGDLREKIVARSIERDHPDDVRAIKEAEDALQLVDVSVRVAFEAVRSAGDFKSDEELDSFLTESLGQRVAAIEDHARQDFANFAAAA